MNDTSTQSSGHRTTPGECTTDTKSVGATRVLPMTEADDWNRRYAAEELIWTAEANRFLMAEVANLPAGTALDLALGEGRNAVRLAELGWTVRAVDFSEVAAAKGAMLASAHQVADKVDFVVADLRTYEPERRRFDLVAIVYLQIPQPALATVIARAAAAVAPGGTFVLVAHDAANLEHGYGGPRHPDMLYTAEHVLAALGNELTIEKAGQVQRPVRTSDGIKVAVDCLVRAHRAK